MAKTTNLVKRREPGELLIHEESSIFCRTSGKITNNLGAAVTAADILGLPLKGGPGAWELAAAADIDGAGTNLMGIILDGPEVLTGLADAGESAYEYSILEFGPAVVNSGLLPADDAVGAAITLANFIADLALLNIKSIAASPTQSVQTT
jgi:hypothetical protein